MNCILYLFLCLCFSCFGMENVDEHYYQCAYEGQTDLLFLLQGQNEDLQNKLSDTQDRVIQSENTINQLTLLLTQSHNIVNQLTAQLSKLSNAAGNTIVFNDDEILKSSFIMSNELTNPLGNVVYLLNNQPCDEAKNNNEAIKQQYDEILCNRNDNCVTLCSSDLKNGKDVITQTDVIQDTITKTDTEKSLTTKPPKSASLNAAAVENNIQLSHGNSILGATGDKNKPLTVDQIIVKNQSEQIKKQASNGQNKKDQTIVKANGKTMVKAKGRKNQDTAKKSIFGIFSCVGNSKK